MDSSNTNAPSRPDDADAPSASGSTEFAVMLKRLRSRAGLSQQTLAGRALISVQAVSALERGYRKAPYRDTLERIAKALNLSPDAWSAFEEAATRARMARRSDQGLIVPQHNLPRQLTSFLGRDEVVSEIAAMTERAPLVSIVGTGGAGKTRAAVAVGAQLLDRFVDGVWFVDLAPLIGPDLVTSAAASVLGVKELGDRPLVDALTASIGGRRMLLVLDNCEHVLSGVRVLASALLRSCANVRLVATSREPLGIAGERVYRIPPLAVPRERNLPTEEALLYGAVALFVDRALAVDARFSIGPRDLEAIVEICRRLDGLPLAIELAAARVTALSPSQLAERLDRAFSVLVIDQDSAAGRHQTMRAAIDWSYGLLSSQARLLFDRLSIFAAGFTLEAATEVCAGEQIDDGDVLDLLSSLVARSLVMVDFARGEARYRLLEVTRQYGLEMLAARGNLEIVARRHAASYLALAERLEHAWYIARERAWLDECAAELDNWRTALGWALGTKGDVSIGQRLAAALGWVWYCLAAAEGRRWIRIALETVDESTPPEVIARLRVAEAELHGAFGEYKASLAAAEEALAALAGVNDPLLVARAKQNAGSAHGALGSVSQADTLLGEALMSARGLENRRLDAMILGDLATARSRSGDVHAARSLYAEALAIYASDGFQRQAASIAGHLAEVEFAAGDAKAALRRAQEALVGQRAAQNRRSVANVLGNMAAYLVALNRFDEAWERATEALTIADEIDARLLGLFVLQHVAAISALAAPKDGERARLDAERAARLSGFVDARLSEIEGRREHTEQQEYDRIVAALRSHFTPRELEDFERQGRQWTLERAMSEAFDAQPDSA